MYKMNRACTLRCANTFYRATPFPRLRSLNASRTENERTTGMLPVTTASKFKPEYPALYELAVSIVTLQSAGDTLKDGNALKSEPLSIKNSRPMSGLCKCCWTDPQLVNMVAVHLE